MVTRAEREARAARRQAGHEEAKRREAAMQAFLDECRACLSPAEWECHSRVAEVESGGTIYDVEYFLWVLAEAQTPITPPLRRALNAMLEAVNWDCDPRNGDSLSRLNLGPYWAEQYARRWVPGGAG